VRAGRLGDRRRSQQTFGRYVTTEWLPNHVIEASTRQGYVYQLDRYILPEFKDMRMIDILPVHVREWVGRMGDRGAKPPTIRLCKSILDAVLTTAFNDQITVLHAGKGVKTPPVARKPRRIITAAQFEKFYAALPDTSMRLLVETNIETGLRWGEITELRVKDLDIPSRTLTVARAVVRLVPEFHPEGGRFLVKDYPKDRDWRQLALPQHLVGKLEQLISDRKLKSDDLLFEHEHPTEHARRKRPEVLPGPDTLGRTEPNAKGRTYKHGTTSAYTAGQCRCQYCRDAMAAYRATRRAEGQDAPRPLRLVETDGHIDNGWFTRNVWNKALEAAELGFRITPHSLRHAHASWLAAGGADIQVIKERLGHGSIDTTAIYMHALPGSEKVVLDAMDKVRGVRDTGASNDSQVQQGAGIPSQLAGSTKEQLAELLAMALQQLDRHHSAGDVS
jgi:integrase